MLTVMTGELELQVPLKSEAVSGVITTPVRTTAVRLNCVEVMAEVISPIQLAKVVPEDAVTVKIMLTGRAAS